MGHRLSVMITHCYHDINPKRPSFVPNGGSQCCGLVEKRPDGSGTTGSKGVATATPDGLTLLLGQTGEMSINQKC